MAPAPERREGRGSYRIFVHFHRHRRGIWLGCNCQSASWRRERKHFGSRNWSRKHAREEMVKEVRVGHHQRLNVHAITHCFELGQFYDDVIELAGFSFLFFIIILNQVDKAR
ncbi:unnamed protein product [Amoebophrya sp. A120]|nr:unnamed protein product [Amoebophrya sp. A120]|eukprot:GSA120T00006160001.1